MNFIGFVEKSRLSSLYKLEYYRNNLNNLKKNWINVLYFFYDDKKIEIDTEVRKNLDDIWFEIIWYQNIEDIMIKLKDIKWIYFINTFQENQIKMVSELKLATWQKSTINYDIFLNKFIQRDTIGSKYPETITKYAIIKNIEEINNINLEYPIIVKPIGWLQSSGTMKVNNIKEMEDAITNIYDNVLIKLQKKWLNESDIILEEYIDGDMYTIDYFVDENQNITRPSPIKIGLWTDYGINDFSNIVRILSNEIQTEIDSDKLNIFIKKTVEAWWFKNTFIHHEFKINSKWEYKTIETNGRIWGYRVEMYEKGNNTNILNYPFIKKWEKLVTQKINNNIATFVLYPDKNCLFLWYNEALLDKIINLESFFRLNKWSTEIWTKIGLTRDWFSKIWTIVLKNDSDKQFQKDMEFINKNYFDIIKMS